MSESADIDVLEELAGLPTMAHPTIAPDGGAVALYYDVTGRNELHVLDDFLQRRVGSVEEAAAAD